MEEAHGCSVREAVAQLARERDTAMEEARAAWAGEREGLQEQVS